jgi:hypothetical protein
MAAYATVVQLEAYTGVPSDVDAPRKLLRASDLLDYHLRTWSYAVDVNGNPTDATVITAFADAVCAQLEWWRSNNDELNELAQWDSMSFEGASFHRAGPLPRLAPRALERLGTLTAVQGVGVFVLRRKIGI